MVICPTTLTFQWAQEVKKFFGKVGTVNTILDHREVHSGLNQSKINLIITSYDKARSQIDTFNQYEYFYLCLDEGHKIKNSKAKITLAIKSLKAERKLVLTGTPL